MFMLVPVPVVLGAQNGKAKKKDNPLDSVQVRASLAQFHIQATATAHVRHEVFSTTQAIELFDSTLKINGASSDAVRVEPVVLCVASLLRSSTALLLT